MTKAPAEPRSWRGRPRGEPTALIRLKLGTIERLKTLKRDGETFDTTIRRLLEEQPR